MLDAFVLDMLLDGGECDRDCCCCCCCRPPLEVRPRAAATTLAFPLALANRAAISPPKRLADSEVPFWLAAAACAAAAATAALRLLLLEVLLELVVVVVVEDEDEVGLIPSVRFCFWSSTLRGKTKKRTGGTC